MSLKVIGAGYGRTGTLSLKYALEELGYNKCHHMLEVIRDPAQQAGWMAAVKGGPTDWDQLFEGFQASVDWPACHFYQELARHYPNAKVLLTVRDPMQWYESMLNTTLRVIRKGMDDGRIGREGNLGTEMVIKATFEGVLDDPAHAVAVFNKRIEAVKANIDPSRLLVFDVRQGWGPLCAFLGKAVPDTPFPRVNSRDEFDEIFFGGGA